MKIEQTKARRKAPPFISTDSSFVDSFVVGWVARRYRLTRPFALIVAAECGLGAR